MQKEAHIMGNQMANDSTNDYVASFLNGNMTIEEINARLQKIIDIEYALDKSSIIAITDRQGKITYVNDLFCEMAQYSREELIGQNHRIINSGYHSKEFFKQMWRTIGNGHIWKGEIKNKKKDGSFYWVHATIVPFLNEKGIPYQYISIRTDITKEKELEEVVARSNEKYRLIAEHSVNLISLIDQNGMFQYISPSFNTVLQYELCYVENSNIFNLIHPSDEILLKKNIDKLLSKQLENVEIEIRIRNSLGQYIYVEADLSRVHNSTYSKEPLILVAMKDITSEKEIEKQILHLSYHDPLTGFPNRLSFMRELRKEIIKSNRIAILFLDLDNFKSVNDQLGHDLGDIFIKEAAKNIKSSIRPSDMAARMGGDEFIIMLRNAQDEKVVQTVVSRILKKFNKPIIVENKEFVVTCSIGVAIYPQHGSTPEELIKNADNALTHVKKGNKNDFLIFNKDIESQSLERRILESAMRNALENEQFFIQYQPKINMITNKLVGMEALVRWEHQDLGVIPPGKFISIAEEIGLIIPLGEWVLKRTCQQVVKWHKKYNTSIVVSVNVSVRQLEDPHFIDKLKKILKETKIKPQLLEIEVTESILADVQNAVEVLNKIRALGVKVSVDDFGTGYSSLSYIKHLPIDIIKIDASFVRDIHMNEESRAIVKAVLNIANSVGLNVIAEGVELKEQIEILCADGCQFAQGYYFSKPLNQNDFEQYLLQFIENNQ